MSGIAPGLHFAALQDLLFLLSEAIDQRKCSPFAAEDIDPDSLMGSSPSDSATEEETDLFPSDTNVIANNHNTVRPLTPQNNHLNALAPGELSPPRSESRSQTYSMNQQTSTAERRHSAANGNDNENLNGNRGRPTEVVGQEIKDDVVGDGKPGSGWKSKRAQEEYHRAMESVVDRDFSLREFGDVLAPEMDESK